MHMISNYNLCTTELHASLACDLLTAIGKILLQNFNVALSVYKASSFCRGGGRDGRLR